MAYTIYNCDSMIGSAARALDAIPIADLSDGFRAFAMHGGRFLPFRFDASSTDAENVAIHPYKVRPDDYSTAGVWVEQMVDGVPITGDNLIINPQFLINQEVVTAGTHSADEYFRDQWKAGAAGCTVSISGDVLTISAGSVIQPIEDVEIPDGTYMLAWQGTAQAKIDGGSAQSSPHTFSVSSGTHVEIEFTTGTVQKPVLVEGVIEGVFKRPDFGLELIKSQRHWRKSYNYDTAPGSADNIGRIIELASRNNPDAIFGIQFKRMRTTPTIIIYSPNSGASGNAYNGTSGDKAVATIEDIGECGFSFLTFASANGSQNISYHYTADARL